MNIPREWISALGQVPVKVWRSMREMVAEVVSALLIDSWRVEVGMPARMCAWNEKGLMRWSGVYDPCLQRCLLVELTDGSGEMR